MIDNDIFDASAAGDIQRVIELCTNHSDTINSKNCNGRTALHYAARQGHRKIVEWLIRHDADLNCRDEYGDTPLLDALWDNQLAVAEDLLAAGADGRLASHVGDTPLHFVAMMGGHGRLKLDIPRSGKPMSIRGLEAADCRDRFLTFAADLIARCVNVNAEGELQSTPLHIAASWGHQAMVELLLQHRANPNAIDGLGRTALDEAMRGNHTLVAQLLAAHGGIPGAG
jgi:ankyrin repeat protein